MDKFKCLGSIIQKNYEVDDDVNNRIHVMKLKRKERSKLHLNNINTILNQDILSHIGYVRFINGQNFKERL